MSTLQRQLRWYIGLRLVVVTSMALPYYLGRLSGEATGAAGTVPSFFGVLFGVTCVATLIYIGMLRWLEGRPQVQAYIQFAGDLLLVTGLLYQFGGTSPFTPFYLVIIILASAMLGRRAGMTVASASFLLYAGLLTALAYGWLSSPSGTAEDLLSPRLLYSLFASLLGFFAVAHLTSHLTGRALRAEGALEVEREDFAELKVVHRDVVESIPSGICTTDRDGHITTINRKGRTILDSGETEYLGRHVSDLPLFTPELWNEVINASAESRRRLRSEVRIHRDDGSYMDVGFSISRLTDSADRDRGFIIIFQDLTRWRKLEEEVRIKDRMAAVGELAAGIAHEIGNPLAAISGSVQMLTEQRELTAAESKLLAIILKESQRLDRTIKGFLRFARPKDRSSVYFDIAALLAENVELLRNSPELSPRHEVALSLDPPTASIVGDPDQISQIFWNLARNGLKAMPGGGQLTIEGRLSDSCYTLRFSDTGRGMSEAERTKLFHPFQGFFDDGTGIGMAIVYRIVQEHGGNLSVDSVPGRGSTLTIELPAIAAPLEVAT